MRSIFIEINQLKNFRKTLTYQKRPIFESINVDVTKRSDISDNTNLNMSKNMDDSAHSFLFAEHTYGKKVHIYIIILFVNYYLIHEKIYLRK